MDLNFKKCESEEDLKIIFAFNVEAFSEILDMKWSLESLQEELEAGWVIYSVIIEEEGIEEIIAVLFVMDTGEALLTKNTPIKLPHQGQGYSHQIKEWFEEMAKSKGIKKLHSYCRTDNFRMISLNETHGYERTGELKQGSDEVVMLEWTKVL